MNAAIQTEIKNFEELQRRFETLGAEDSEPDYIFHLVIATAIFRGEISFGDDEIDWNLYEGEAGLAAAEAQLTRQAKRVHDAVIEHANETDIVELKKYCWRLDPAEFEP